MKVQGYCFLYCFFLINLSGCIAIPERNIKKVDYRLAKGLNLQTKKARQKLALNVLNQKDSHKTKGSLYSLKTNDNDCYEIVMGQSSAKKMACDKVKIFGMGSFSKIFTTTLLAALVKEKLIDLDESIFTTLPDNVQQANPSLKKITYRELASHQSGLPIHGPGLWRFYLAVATTHSFTGSNAYAYLNESYAMDSLKTLKLPEGSLRTKYRYSNFGIALLGYAMSHKLKQSYAHLFQHYLATPLHLNNTYLSVNAIPDSQYTPGHAGVYVFYKSASASLKKWDIPDFMIPSMGYFSDVNDVAKLIKAWQGRSHTYLDLATQLFSEKDKARIFNKQRLSLSTANKERIKYHKNGIGAGYNNELYFTERGPLFVVLLGNEFTDRDNIAYNLFELLSNQV